MTNKPELKGNPSPDISHLEISEEGVKKLLSNVNPKKTNGPDNIPNRVLKDCVTNIAPYATTIYHKSYAVGSVPDDWIMVVITALFKREMKASQLTIDPFH